MKQKKIQTIQELITSCQRKGQNFNLQTATFTMYNSIGGGCRCDCRCDGRSIYKELNVAK